MSLKISAKTEYACIAVIELATRHSSAEPVRVRDIAERHSVPPRFLVQILLQLKSAGLVESTRGATGGYRLKRMPEDVTLGEIMGIMEAPIMSENRAKSPAVAESSAALVLHNVWDVAEQYRQAYLNRITLADLIRNAGVPSNGD